MNEKSSPVHFQPTSADLIRLFKIKLKTETYAKHLLVNLETKPTLQKLSQTLQ